MSAESQDQPQGGAEAASSADPHAGPQGEPRSPDEIREDIEQTRAELGDTVEALAAKTDVKEQARLKVEEVKENVRDNVGAKRDEFSEKARATTPDNAQQGVQRVIALVKANPAPVAIAGAIILGVLIGRATARG